MPVQQDPSYEIIDGFINALTIVFERSQQQGVIILKALHPQRPSYVQFWWDWKQRHCCIAYQP